MRLQRLKGLLDKQRQAASLGNSRGSTGSSSGGSAGAHDRPRPVRLLVVDSIAHVFRDLEHTSRAGQAAAAELTGRAGLLFRISALLRRAPGAACLLQGLPK
jgi:hypothetical protein